MRSERKSGCRTRKRKYADEVAARLALAEIRGPRAEVRAETPCRAYDCPFCGGWHLTSMESFSEYW